MTKSAIFAVAACLAALGFASASQAQDDARSVGDTAMPHQMAPGQPAPISQVPAGSSMLCPPAHLPREYPRRAHPGQCFARVRTPPTYESYSVQVMVAPARVDHHVIPATYEWAERQVMVAPARVDRHVIPATYRNVIETEVVAPATVRVEHIEAIYDMVPEQVMVRPSHTEWRRTFVGPDGLLPAGARVEATGEVICLIEIPAEYSTVEHRVLREPARTIETPIPAVTRTVVRQVIDQPESFTDVQIPAEYRTERYQRVATPERVVDVEIPAVYATRTQQRMTSPGHLAWRPTVCTPKRIQGS